MQLTKQCGLTQTGAVEHEYLPAVQRSAPERRAPPRIQRKLVVGAPGDEYEQEADKVAAAIGAGRAAPPISAVDSEPAPVARETAGSESEPALAGAGTETRLRALGGRGSPIPAGSRPALEARFRFDFSAVRLHADGEAHRLSGQLGALAFTHGNDIYFGAGSYRPGTAAGNRLLAHELAHVVQQSGGRAGRSSRGQEGRGAESGQVQLQRDPAAGGSPQAGRRILIDGNLLDQINRGNAPAATQLNALCQTAKVYIAQQAYNEVVVNPQIPRMAKANQLVLDALRIEVAPPGDAAERAEVYQLNQTASGGTVLANETDVLVGAQARAIDAEVWSPDRAYRNNAVGVSKALGIKVAPESVNMTIATGPQDYRVGRRLLGLDPVEISLSGVVTPVSSPPGGGGGGGGAGGGGGGAAGGGGGAVAAGGGGGSGETTATVGEPLPPIGADPGVQGFQARSAGTGAAALVIVGALNNISRWSTDYAATKEWEKTKPEVQKMLSAQPWLGVLIVFRYSQGSAPITMQAPQVFQQIDTYYGESLAAAQSQERAQGYVVGAGAQEHLISEKRWIAPVAPGSKPKSATRVTPGEPAGPKNATELDKEMDSAIAGHDWNRVALSLNGFNNDDLNQRVTSDARLTGHRRELMRAALDTMILWPARPGGITDAIYDCDPEAARQGRVDFVDAALDTGRGGEPPRNFGSEKWKKAALALNGFSDDDLSRFIPRDLDKCKLIRDECIKLGTLDRVKKAIEDAKPGQDWSIV
jgi:uncharacterized protein DUF4157